MGTYGQRQPGVNMLRVKAPGGKLDAARLEAIAEVVETYSQADLDHLGLDPQRDIAEPGQYPFTRGIHETMYRGRLWTMRLFSGFGSAEETNARFRYLLDHGETGLSIAFDLPTLYGRDTDDPLAEGEFGKCGVAISSLADMEQALLEKQPVTEQDFEQLRKDRAEIVHNYLIDQGEIEPERVFVTAPKTAEGEETEAVQGSKALLTLN